MTEKVEVVIARPLVRRVLPEWTNEGVALLLHLVREERVEEIARRLPVHRGGGYAGVDGFVFLLLYFASGRKVGLKEFAGQSGPHGEALAGLAGRRRLPTQAALSRLLGDIDEDVVRAQTQWFLRELSGALSVLGHPAMMTLDANGDGWQVFDYDPTKTVLRRRALPAGPDLPTARRHTDDFAAPGHTGHKRGEVVVRRSVLQHAGSSIWLDMRLAPGNGDRRIELDSAIQTVVETCQRLQHPVVRAVMRQDGEYGDIPSLAAFRAQGLPALTRLNRPRLLDQPEVRKRMATQPWYVVPDSRSGPTRSAMDLGVVTVRPGRDTRRDDGTPYEPVDVRVVVSRYPRTGEAEHGRVIDGWQYELFAALDLPADAWPAPDVVAAYFGRGGQENRFAQEDRELQLDRIYSYHLPGQELACLVGLLVWNLRVVHGFHLDPLPACRHPAPARERQVDPRPASMTLLPVEAPAQSMAQAPLPREDPHEALAEALRELDWAHLLRRRPDWQFATDEAQLRCPAGLALSLTTVDGKPGRRSQRMIFRAPPGRCRTCPFRPACLGSSNADAVKLISLAIPTASATRLAARLAPVHLSRRRKRSAKALAEPLPSGRTRQPPAGQPLSVNIATPNVAPGDEQISGPQFSPSAARGAFRSATRALAVRINVRTSAEETPHPYLVTRAQQRQRRRATWAERTAWYALADTARVEVVVHAGAALAATFPWAAQQRGLVVSRGSGGSKAVDLPI